MPDAAPSKDEQRLLTRAQYAQRRAVSRAMISKYFRAGRLVMVDDFIDADASDALLAGSLNPARGGKRAKATKRAKAARPGQQQTGGGTFLAERTSREKYSAMLLQVEYDKSVGTLVERDGVTRALTANIGPTIQRLQTISSRLAARVAAEADVRKCGDLIDGEVGLVMQEISDYAQALIDGAGKARQ